MYRERRAAFHLNLSAQVIDRQQSVFKYIKIFSSIEFMDRGWKRVSMSVADGEIARVLGD